MREEQKKLLLELGTRVVQVVAEYGMEHADEIVSSFDGKGRRNNKPKTKRPQKSLPSPGRRRD